MPLSAQSSWALHIAQNGLLVWLSFILSPLTTGILLVNSVLSWFHEPPQLQERSYLRAQPSHIFQPRTVLVTGVGMSKGLVLARIFYQAGHNVVGADFEPLLLPISCGRVSTSLKTFYRLPSPAGRTKCAERYAQRLVSIIRREKIDLWVSCSGVASALEDGYAKELVERLTRCKAVQFDVATTQQLHEKHSFIDHARDLGLPTPETYTVHSKKALSKVLERSSGNGKQYILKYIGTDDSVRGDMTLLPKETREATETHIARLPISDERPWILQQYIDGPEYCTHSLVVRGEIKAFVACPSAELLMHYTALPPKSSLSQTMLRFTREIANAAGENFTGHLSFDFLVNQQDARRAQTVSSASVKIYPIECNPRAHTAGLLFHQTPELAGAYLSLLSRAPSHLFPPAPPAVVPEPLYPASPSKHYWIGHDLLVKLIIPCILGLLGRSQGLRHIRREAHDFVQHIIYWRDGIWESWDPWPAWWLYHVYWPYQFLVAMIFGRKWSRVNISTCKMFMC